jgi:hypothetical protein
MASSKNQDVVNQDVVKKENLSKRPIVLEKIKDIWVNDDNFVKDNWVNYDNWVKDDTLFVKVKDISSIDVQIDENPKIQMDEEIDKKITSTNFTCHCEHVECDGYCGTQPCGVCVDTCRCRHRSGR